MGKKQFSVDILSWASSLVGPMVLLLMVVGIVLSIPDASRAASNRSYEKGTMENRISGRYNAQILWMAAAERGKGQSGSGLSQEEKTAREKNLERWKSLPSGEKKELRERLHQWKNLTPQEQNKYKRRFQKWQQLTPEQQKKINQSLDRWDSLSSEEKQAIRRLFEE